MRKHHRWRQKSKHQQICSVCGQVKRWDGLHWLYRKQGQMVRERPPCQGERTDAERYAELRQMVEEWQHWQREPRYDQADASELLMNWSHR